MIDRQMVREIIDMKLKGYSINEIIEYYEGKTGKTPSRPTIRKYYEMDVVPDDLGCKLEKDKVFDNEPFKSAIIKILKNNRNCYSSSVYDVLIERFVEEAGYDSLPGSERTLRTYIGHLRESGQVESSDSHGRIYDHVFDTPPGQQMLIDFGEEHISKNLAIHFICMLLRYSRMICVYAQDHRFNAEEACRAIYHGFCKLGGRPKELVIDQDPVFVSKEYLGEITQTEVFRTFTTEQELKLWVCNKEDPESKGPIENVVGFVKKNFFSARSITCIDDVWRSLPGWLRRKNKRIHQATFCVPIEIFSEIEREALRPIVPSVYDNAPSSYIEIYVGDKQYIQYKSSKYSVPRKFCFKKIYYKATDGRLHVYGPDMKYECTHNINLCKGSFSKLPEHMRQENTDWLAVTERLRAKWNCYDFQHFINGFKKENPRHLFKQLSAVEALLDAEAPDRGLVADVMAESCRDFRYQFTQFKAVYDRIKSERFPVHIHEVKAVQHASLDVYQQAFMERCDN